MYFVGGDRVTNTVCEKDQGTYINKQLNFETKRKDQLKKDTRMVGAVRKSFKFLNSNIVQASCKKSPRK